MMKPTEIATYQHLLRTDFATFAERCFHELNPGSPFLWNWHVEIMAGKLADAAFGHGKRLIVNLPPRHLKSHLASIALPAFLLGKNPSAQIICVSYSQDLAEKFARDCRTIMRTEWYARLFPLTVVSNEKSSVEEITTTLKGTRIGTSVGGGLTGRGGDVIIIDDPQKPQEALSETSRSSVNQWFDNTLMSRLNQKRSGNMIIVMQRLHEDDLVGHVMAQRSWDVLSFAAIAEHDETYVVDGPLGRFTHHRHVEDALHPERESAEMIRETAMLIGSYNFSSQYQQAPIPMGGHMIRHEWIGYYQPGEQPDSFDRIICSWDCANKASNLSDYSVCTTWGVKSKTYYLIDVFRKKLDYPDLKREVRAIADRYKATEILIEDKASGTQLIQELKKEGVHRITAYAPGPYEKAVRVHTQTAKFEAGQVYLPRGAPWLSDYVRELTGFPGSKHDDQVDSTVQFLDWVGTYKPSIMRILWERQQAGLPPISTAFEQSFASMQYNQMFGRRPPWYG